MGLLLFAIGLLVGAVPATGLIKSLWLPTLPLLLLPLVCLPLTASIALLGGIGGAGSWSEKSV